MSETHFADAASVNRSIAEVKKYIGRALTDALTSVQWEFNQRYLFGNESDKPTIEPGHLYSLIGQVPKGAIFTALDSGKLYMNTASGWKNIGSLNNLSRPDLISIFNPRKDYPVSDPIDNSGVGGEYWIPYPFKKYEKYAIIKSQGPFTASLSNKANDRNAVVQSITGTSQGAGTYQFVCMTDEAKYFYYTTGSSSNVLETLKVIDLGSALEPVKLSNITDPLTYITFPIEKGKTYYYTKTARSFAIFYGNGSGNSFDPLKQVNNSGDSGAGSWSFKAEHDATTIRLYIGNDASLESFEIHGEDLPDYVYTYPFVVRTDEVLPSEPRVGDMIFHPYAKPTGQSLSTPGIPLWYNGTEWVTSLGGSWESTLES